MSDELGVALRDLVARYETPPRVDAAEIRGRAGRRSRRRRTALALGTAACVLTAVALTLDTGAPAGNRHRPGTAPDVPAPSAAAPGEAAPSMATPGPRTSSSGVLDLGRHTLTVGDRVLRVASHSFGRIPAGTRLTVAAKTESDLLPLEGRPGTEKPVEVPYLVELRTPGREAVYAAGLTFDTRALMSVPGKDGWVGMSLGDAEWFYHRVRVGARIEITSTATPGAPAGTARDTPVPQRE
ncbi:hypothetical protein HTV45_21360 [Streptomyces sp. CHD11]|uniref:hypothetical protein n=1 Tax=Streptomyces sp. CHD11 TaxID=2741325 RepID=UPI001BFCB245|nr:hypothetical protein [Streptomyces sp. CHD11]MBT3153384.1 hypothetical protein [Streptomyces sp. CHD11]